MICEFCKSKNANVHLIKIINGNTEKINLCIECLKNLAFFPADDLLNDLSKILDKVFEVDIKINDKSDYEKLFKDVSKGDNRHCSFCGMDLNTIRTLGRMGCPECYSEFREVIKPVIKAIHGSVEHIGRVPEISVKEIKIEKEIKDLEFKLKEEIFVENFEEAARLRDTIKRLQKKLTLGRVLE